MRLLTSILSIYILGLIATPCIDEHDYRENKNIEQSQNTNDNHHNEDDDCSPFCTCRCCTSPIVIKDYVVHFKCFSFTIKSFLEYTSDYVSSIYSTIWQPPKIS